MELLKKKFYERCAHYSNEIREIKKNYGNEVIGQVTVEQFLTGMKGVPSLLTSTSNLDPEEGIRFRGYTIPELRKLLPRKNQDGEPLPEGLFYLMLMGELPSQDDVDRISRELAKRIWVVPKHVFNVIDSMSEKSRPMTQFASGILAAATLSNFHKAYHNGLHKKDYWNSTFEDVLDLIAILPRIAAYIYRKNFHSGDIIEPNPDLDWAANFAYMMGFDNEEVYRLFRLYLFLHADHEGGNVSAHTTHLVGSALSNAHFAYAAGMNGLAGPLHGFANQEVIRWIFDMLKEIGSETPTKEQITAFVSKTLSNGKVIPGYGHAVLRKTDPRFSAQLEFAQKYFPDDKLLNVIEKLYEVVPPVLKSLGKVKNPWPNVDAISGTLLLHYGIKEYQFYTVMFGVSRSLGVLSSLILDRIYGLPIERPKSQTISWLKNRLNLPLTEAQKRNLRVVSQSEEVMV